MQVRFVVARLWVGNGQQFSLNAIHND
jgi:hypothetical protein